MRTFSAWVVELARNIPPGKVTTYGRIARAAGGGGMAAQSITAILSKAYKNGITDIPWHRIVYADGRVWTSARTKRERLRLYQKEGIEIDARGRVKNFRDVLVEFR